MGGAGGGTSSFMSHDTASARTSCIAMRVGFRLRASTRGLAPFCSCFARWAATVMNRNLLSTSRGTIRCDISALLVWKRAQDPLDQAVHAADAAPRGADHGEKRLDAVLQVLVDDRVLVLAVQAQLLPRGVEAPPELRFVVGAAATQPPLQREVGGREDENAHRVRELRPHLRG